MTSRLDAHLESQADAALWQYLDGLEDGLRPGFDERESPLFLED